MSKESNYEDWQALDFGLPFVYHLIPKSSLFLRGLKLEQR